MAETKMQLVDWLDDLCVRFIINLPREELESVERICFQVEEAQWFYEDFIRPMDPTLPSMNLKQFCLLIFQHCPLLANFSEDHHLLAFEEFLTYKTRVPVRGAILLNDAMDKVLLVKGWKKGASWSFPRGKINKDERDLDCAIREAYEETGFDIAASGLIHDESQKDYIEITMREQNMKLFIFRGVQMDTMFAPRTRKEISKIEWYKLASLPGYHKKKHVQPGVEAASASKMYMVAPFMGALKRWIAQQRRAAVVDSEVELQFSVPATQTPQYQHDNGAQSTFAAEPFGLQSQATNGREHNAVEMPYETHHPSQQTPVALDQAAKLKALLSIKSSVSSPASPDPISQEATLLAMLRRAPHPPPAVQSPAGVESFTLASSLTGQESNGQALHGLSAPRPYERTGDPQFAQPTHPGVPSVPPASQLPAPKLNEHAMSLLNSFKTKSKPTQEGPKPVITGSVANKFGLQAWQNLATQLPQLEAESGRRMRQEHNNRSADESAPAFQPVYKETFRQTTAGNVVGQRQVVAVSKATHGWEGDVSSHPASDKEKEIPVVETEGNDTLASSKAPAGNPWGAVPRVQATSLLDLFRSAPKAESQTVLPVLPPSQARLTPGPVELSAIPSPDTRQQIPELAVGYETPKSEKVRRQKEPRASPSGHSRASPLTSATVNGPMSTPEMGTVRRRPKGHKSNVSQTIKPLDNHSTPIKILKRPVTEVVKEAEVLSAPPVPRPIESLAKPSQTFAPQILSRPSDSETPRILPSFPPKKPVNESSVPLNVESMENTPVKPFQILKRPQQPSQVLFTESDALKQDSLATEPAPSPFDRRASTTNDRKQALLSLFGGALSTETPTAPNVAQQPDLRKQVDLPLRAAPVTSSAISTTSNDMAVTSPATDTMQASVTSLGELRSPPPGLELSRSRINSIASAPRAGSAGGFSASGARSQTPMSPQDRGFLMNFLEGVVKSAAR